MTTVYELTSNEFFYFVSNVVVNYHFDFFDPDDIKYVRLNDTNYVKVKHRNNKKWFIITMNGIIEYFEFKRKVGVSKAEKVINRQLFFTLNNLVLKIILVTWIIFFNLLIKILSLTFS